MACEAASSSAHHSLLGNLLQVLLSLVELLLEQLNLALQVLASRTVSLSLIASSLELLEFIL